MREETIINVDRLLCEKVGFTPISFFCTDESKEEIIYASNSLTICYLINGRGEYYYNKKKTDIEEALTFMDEKEGHIRLKKGSKKAYIFRCEGEIVSIQKRQRSERRVFYTGKNSLLSRKFAEVLKSSYLSSNDVLDSYVSLFESIVDMVAISEDPLNYNIVKNMIYLAEKSCYLSRFNISKEFIGSPFSSDYLLSVFKEKMGVSFSRYYENIKTEKCVYDLRFTNLPIKEISQRYGFKNEKSFNTFVRKVTGIDVVRFRDNAKE